MATINNDFKVKNGLVVGTTATILSNETAISTATGALTVLGGAGIGKDLHVGGIVVASGYDLLSYDGSVHYVSDSIGSDSNDGHRLISAFKTIKHALTQAQSGDKVYIEAGTYHEQFPLTIPQGVSVRGAGLRAVTVQPTTATNTQTAFLLNGESYISDFTVTGFYKPGSAFAFAPGAKITTRSPYVERFSVITRGSNPTANDPYGFDSADAGNGAYLDASVLNPTSLEPAMLWNEATFIVPNATGFYMTNGARAELLNGFTYFADKSIHAEVGAVGYGGVGKTRLKLSGVTGNFVTGDTIIYKNSAGTVLASGTISSTASGYIFLNGPIWGFQTATDASTSTQIVYSSGVSPSTATSIILADYHQFGAELRCIGSAAVFGNQGVIANGTGTDLKLIAFNLSAIGSGKDLSDDFSLTVQSNEIIQTNGGKIYYQTVDQYGDFRVGDKFLVNQRTGDISFNSATINLSNLSSLVISDGINSTTLTPGNIVVGNLNFAGNTISSRSGNITIDPSGTLTTINSDTTINGKATISSTINSTGTDVGALVVTGGVGIGGNLHVGGTMYGAFFGSLSGVATTATNLYLGTAGQIPYQSAPSQTRYTGPGDVGTVLVSRGESGPVFQNTLTLSSTLYNTGTSTASNALYVAGGVGASYLNLANEGWINGAQIVTTATLGSSFGTGGVVNPINITNTGSNAFTVIGGAVIGGNLLIGGNVQFNGSVTTIDSTSVDIGSKVIYLSTLSNTALQAFGSGLIIGTNPGTSTVTNTWASLTFDGTVPGNWVMGNGLLPGSASTYDIGSQLFKWATVYANTVTAVNVYDNANRVVTQVTPSGGDYIGISNITSAGPIASFTINNLGVQTLTGSAYIQVSTSTGTVTLTNTGVTDLSSGTDITLTASTGSITINNVSTLQSVTSRGSTTTNSIKITNATASTGTTTGALTVIGGVGIQGRVYAGTIFSNGNQVLTSGGGGAGYVSGIIAGTDIGVNTSTGEVTISNISTLQSVTSRGSTTTNAIKISNSTASIDTTSGALVVSGGVGIAKSLYAAQIYDSSNRVVTAVTPSSGSGIDISNIVSTGTATSFTISNTGVLAVAGTAYLGVSSNTGSITITNLGVQTLTAGTDTRASSSTGTVTIWNNSTLQTVTGRGSETNNPISITNATASTGTTTGALIISGGLGVQGSIYAGNIYSNNSQVITQETLGSRGVTKITAGTGIHVNTSTGDVIVTNIGTTATFGSTYIGVSANTGSVTITNLGVQTLTAGTDTRVSSSTGTVTIWNESTLQTVTGRGATSNAAVTLTNTLSVSGQTNLGSVTATNLVVNGTVQHNGLVLTNGLNIDQVYSTSTTITLTTEWQDTDVDAAELATGSYMVQCTANDSGVGGNEVNTYYTGIMSWYSNGNTENSYDEITLHRAGAVSGSGAIFLQVLRTNGGFTKLQIAGTTNNSGPSTYALKFRRMI